ncbi:MAG: hypothetical protein AAB679_00210 [Patescibacteria group bacterium]
MSKQYLVHNGYVCFWSNNQENKNECIQLKFIKNSNIKDCYNNNVGLEINSCIHGVAYSKEDISICDLLQDTVVEDRKDFWGYTDKETCISAVIYKSGNKERCDLIENTKYSSTCKEVFDIWDNNIKEERERTNFFEKVVNLMK